jgi:hypothetical protein
LAFVPQGSGGHIQFNRSTLQEVAMNWIFEVYGDTYNAMLMQNRRRVALPASDGAAFNSMQVLHAIGYLFSKR